MKEIKSPEELLRAIDWALLREQKHMLVVTQQLLLDPNYSQKEYQAIDGVLQLMDELQDCALDYLDIPAEIVFSTREQL